MIGSLVSAHAGGEGPAWWRSVCLPCSLLLPLPCMPAAASSPISQLTGMLQRGGEVTLFNLATVELEEAAARRGFGGAETAHPGNLAWRGERGEAGGEAVPGLPVLPLGWHSSDHHASDD